MAISYPVDVVATRWAVLRISTGEIISRNAVWPRADGGPIVGLDPDYVYLLHVNSTPPDYDSRLYFLQGTETVDAEDNEIRLTYDAVKRPLEEQIVAAENVETEQLQRHLRLEREALETRLMLGALIKFVLDNMTMPPKVRTMADEYAAKAIKLFKNRDRLAVILADIEAGREPDLDAGWENV
jgi:hypothetical protein